MSAGLRKVPSISRIELKIKRTLTVLLCRGPSFFSQILRARYKSHLKKIDLTSYLELLQCLRMPTLMVKFVGTIDKRLYSAFSQFHLLGLCHVKLKSTFRSCSSRPASSWPGGYSRGVPASKSSGGARRKLWSKTGIFILSGLLSCAASFFAKSGN